MVFSSFLSACAANINIKTTVCTIFSLPATKIQYPATAAGNRVTERLRVDRQNPGRETAEEAGRPRRSPVVGRAGERPQGGATGQGPARDHRATGNRTTPAGRKATGRGSQNRPRATERAKPARNLTRRTRDPGGAGRETRAGRDEKPGRAQKNGPQSSDCSPSFRERKSYFAFFLS